MPSNRGDSLLGLKNHPSYLALSEALGEILLHAPDEHWVRREPGTVSLLHNLTIAKRNTPFAQFESGLSTGVKHG